MSNKHLPRLFARALNAKRVELFDEASWDCSLVMPVPLLAVSMLAGVHCIVLFRQRGFEC